MILFDFGIRYQSARRVFFKNQKPFQRVTADVKSGIFGQKTCFSWKILGGLMFFRKKCFLKVPVENRYFLYHLVACFTTFTTLVIFLCEISVGWRVFKKCIFLKCRQRTSTLLTILVPHATFSRLEIIQLCLLQTLLAKTCIKQY